MNQGSIGVLALFFCLCCSSTLAEDELDHVRARQLLNEGKVLTLEQILIKAHSRIRGQLLEIELEEKHDLILYEIEFLAEDGRVHKLYFDAATGDLLNDSQGD